VFGVDRSHGCIRTTERPRPVVFLRTRCAHARWRFAPESLALWRAAACGRRCSGLASRLGGLAQAGLVGGEEEPTADQPHVCHPRPWAVIRASSEVRW